MRKLLLGAALLAPCAARAQYPTPTFNSLTLVSPLAQSSGGTGAASFGAGSFTASGATQARALSDKSGDMHSLADYLSSGQTTAQLVSGSIDAGPALTAALANTFTVSGSPVFAAAVSVPCGFYRFDTQPTFSTSGYFQSAIRGVSPSCVTFEINYQVPVGSAFLNYTAQSYVDVEGITFTSLVAQAAGSVLQLNQTFGTTLTNLVFSGSSGKTLFDNVVLNGANTTVASNVQMRPFSGTDACILAIGSVAQTADFTLIGSGINGCARGLVTNNASGIYVSDVDMTGGTSVGVSIQPSAGGTFTGSAAAGVLTVTTAPTGSALLDVGTALSGTGFPAGAYVTGKISGTGTTGTYALNTGLTVASGTVTAIAQNVNAFFSKNLLTDSTSNGNNFQVIGNGAVTELHLTQLWAGGAGNSGTTSNGPYIGLYLNNANLDGAQLEHVYAHGNGSFGIDIEQGQHILMSDAQACMNSQFTSGGYAGMVVAAPVNYLSLSMPFSGTCGYFSKVAGQTNKQSYGLVMYNNASQTITMVGGQFPGNVTGTWSHNGSDANFNGVALSP